MAALVLVNGKIVTVDEQFSIRQAVAIEGERITAVGEDAAVLARSPADARVADLGGRTVIPGLIDNHNHFVRATEHAEVRLDGVRTRAAALDLLARGAAGVGNRLGEGRSRREHAERHDAGRCYRKSERTN